MQENNQKNNPENTQNNGNKNNEISKDSQNSDLYVQDDSSVRYSEEDSREFDFQSGECSDERKEGVTEVEAEAEEINKNDRIKRETQYNHSSNNNDNNNKENNNDNDNNNNNNYNNDNESKDKNRKIVETEASITSAKRREIHGFGSVSVSQNSEFVVPHIGKRKNYIQKKKNFDTKN